MTFQRVLGVDELDPGEVTQVVLDGHALAIARDSDGSWHALDDACSHGNVSLSDGDIDDGGIECWKHGASFDLRTGKPRCLPATQPVAVYPVSIEDDSVLVDLQSTTKA